MAAKLANLGQLHAHRPASASWLTRDLTFGQVRLLVNVRKHGPITMSRLAEILDVTPATTSGLIDRLERHGLVERSHRADDRRVVHCSLTADGERLVREMAGARLDAMRGMLAVLTPDELAQFDHLLSIVAERLSARTAEAGS